MPELPSAETVYGQRRAPRPQRSVQGYRTGDVEQAQVNAGKALAETGDDIDKLFEERKQEKDKLDIARAQSYALQKTTELETNLLQDPDYATHPEKWQKGFNEIRAGALSMVPADKRELFAIALNDMNTASSNKIKRNVYDMQGQALAGEAVKIKDAMTATAATKAAMGDEPGALASIQTAYNAFEAAQRGGAYRGMADNGASIGVGLRSDMAEAVLANIPADQRVKLFTPNETAPLSVRNNNPGNMRGADGEFIVFPTKEAGMDAMRKDLEIKISGKSKAMEANFGADYKPTLANMISTWAPSTENDTQAYINTVAAETGIAPDQELTKGDIDKVMNAMIKVEGGTAASNNFAQAKGLVALVPAEKRMKMFEDAKIEHVYSMMDNDPAAALDGLNKGTLGAGLDPSKIKVLKEEANVAMTKAYDRAEIGRIAADAVADKENYQKFLSGDMTLADIGAIEAASGQTSFTRMARAKLVSERPERSDGEKVQEFDRLQTMMAEIRSRAGKTVKTFDTLKASVSTIKDYRLFQAEVMRSVEDGLISTDEGQKFIGDFSKPIINAISKDSSDNSGEWSSSGIQDPYAIAFKEFNAVLERKGRGSDLAAKKELTLRFSDYLGDYESSGNTEKDEQTISAAILKAKASFARDSAPGMRMLGGTPNSVVKSDGTGIGISSGKSDVPADSKISIPPVTDVPSFANEAEAEASGYKGLATINGRPARVK